ncbi:MAG: GNAT family N-acetyltransferase [Gammaproteobacteria bacterium]|nr:GNAT family N-acetyltransferase [Gammaproteobacteria bacterium]
MELKIINTNEDKTNEIYSSTDCQQLINSMDEYYPKIGFNKPWVGYFVFNNNQIVGTGSFTGQPQDGKVEIAYWTFKEFEGQGIASFACKELISISKKTNPTITITAKTAPGHNASTKILQNNGFEFSCRLPHS